MLIVYFGFGSDADHLAVAKWLHDKMATNTACAFRSLAVNEAWSERLDGLQRLLYAHFLYAQNGMDKAAKHGHVDVIMWLHEYQHARGTL